MQKLVVVLTDGTVHSHEAEDFILIERYYGESLYLVWSFDDGEIAVPEPEIRFFSQYEIPENA